MTPEQPIRFAGSELGEYRHICAFFHTQDEEYRVFVKCTRKRKAGFFNTLLMLFPAGQFF